MFKMISKTLRSLVLAAALGATLTAQDDERDTAWLIEVLQAKPGSVLADIGAGPEALLTIPIARHVGPSGRVYATEIGAQSFEKLRAAIQKANVPNVQILAGAPSSTNLPVECCDAIFVRYVYHHFADPFAMNASLRQSLKPGGRLAIIEFAPEGREAPAAADRAAGDTHGVGAESVARELQHAAFELVTSEQRGHRGRATRLTTLQRQRSEYGASVAHGTTQMVAAKMA